MTRITHYLVEIEEELALYKSMVEALPQSMFLLDKNKTIIGIFNAAPETLAGIPVEEVVGQSILKFANDPESPFFQACSMLNSTFDPVFKTGSPLKFQYMVLDSYLEAVIIKISDERVLSQVRDVTDIALKLQDAESRKHDELAMALMAGGLTSWSYNVKDSYLYSNQDNDIIGERISLDKLLLLIQPEYRQITLEMFNNIISGGSKLEHVTIPVQIQGDIVQWTDIHAIPHEYNSEGEVTLIIGSQKDISKEYEYNEKLKKLIQQNELILNNTDSGFVYLTPDLNLEWENVSKAFIDTEIASICQLGTFDPTNLLLLFCMDIAKQVLETKNRIARKFNTDLGMIVEVIGQLVLNDEGHVEGVVLQLDDVTAKEDIISELALAKEKAEQSDKLKSSFLANMSHEIRTPLNSIIGFAQLVPTAESAEEQQQFIDIVNTNSEVLLNLINDILDLSKIEAGYFGHNNTTFDLSELFNELEFVFKHKIQHGIELIKEIPVEEYFVTFDRVRIIQVVSNFMTNALKFTKQGHIKMGFEIMQHGVKLFVEDTGCGMREEDIDRVFERFEKLDSFEQGTGLGASIAKAIVNAYGGDIGVVSQLGKGSTFWAFLPADSNEEDIKVKS